MDLKFTQEDYERLIEKAPVPALAEVAKQLLGCSWGRRLWSETDSALCDQKADRVIVLHEGDEELEVQLCQRHLDVMDEWSTPHADG